MFLLAKLWPFGRPRSFYDAGHSGMCHRGAIMILALGQETSR